MRSTRRSRRKSSHPEGAAPVAGLCGRALSTGNPQAIHSRRRREAQNEVIGTYTFPSRTVQVLRTQDNRILWSCDCEKFRRQNGQREPLWCKHIDKAAARRSLEST